MEESPKKQKLCKGCGKFKAINQFYKDKHINGGHKNKCIPCYNQMRKVTYRSEIRTAVESQFIEEKKEIDKKIAACSDPDDMVLLLNEYDALIDKYVSKWIERNSE